MERKTTIVVVLALGLLLLAQSVLAAEPTAPTSLDIGVSSTRDLSGLPTQTVDAVAGNITQVNISALSVTKGWQGYYGNVSGVITLDDVNNNTFYNWSMTSASGEVYASRAAAITWTDVNCTNTTEVATEETALGMSATDADSVSNTFSQATSHPTFDVGDVTIPVDNCYATNAFDNTGAQTSEFFQILLSDGSGDIVYTTIMQGAATGFNGQAWDFQLLVGEDGHGNSVTTPYYFWVEIN